MSGAAVAGALSESAAGASAAPAPPTITNTASAMLARSTPFMPTPHADDGIVRAVEQSFESERAATAERRNKVAELQHTALLCALIPDHSIAASAPMLGVAEGERVD
jgi:hypothetical protein